MSVSLATVEALIKQGWTIEAAFSHLEGTCDILVCTGSHEATYNVITESGSGQPTLVASMISWDEAQVLQSALTTLAEADLLDAFQVLVVKVNER